MKNGKMVLLSTIIISMLLLASCVDEGGEGEVYKGGTQGLIFTFLEGTPPLEVYDGGAVDFDIALQIKNAGEFDINKIYFTIQGISQNDFQGNYLLSDTMQGWITNELGRDGLIGTTLIGDDEIDGYTEVVTLANGLRFTSQILGGGSLPYTLLLDACYPYATLATSTICLQKDYYDGNNNVCDPKSGGTASVSGAPLQITSFTQSAAGRNKLNVKYVFELKSNAKIWAPKSGDQQTCYPSGTSQRIKEEGVFYVEIDPKGAGTITCRGFRDGTGLDGTHIKDINQVNLGATGNSIIVRGIEASDNGFLKLTDGKATLDCTLTLDHSSTNSQGTINVLAAYYVQDSVRTSFSVRHSGESWDGTTGSGSSGSGTSGGGTAPPSGGTQGGAQLITCQGDLDISDCPNIVYSSFNHPDATTRMRCDNAIAAVGCPTR